MTSLFFQDTVFDAHKRKKLAVSVERRPSSSRPENENNQNPQENSNEVRATLQQDSPCIGTEGKLDSSSKKQARGLVPEVIEDLWEFRRRQELYPSSR